jgi:hypothetical protein
MIYETAGKGVRDILGMRNICQDFMVGAFSKGSAIKCATLSDNLEDQFMT